MPPAPSGVLAMPRSFAAVVVAAGLVGSGGCSPGGPSSEATRAAAGPRPHGGLVFALPGEKGFGELVVEYEKAARKAKGSGRSQVVVYFLQPDGKSALSPP